ncbi:unnamed protein product [Symbiodinium natans]|uniref:Uncharacterized protein n=1 Tax=Symbiodinium natans TaxID=878477 RepID=A0A812G0M3_9DINO|nr:unnamed protein product [Symbiodinium natans]
MDPGRLSQMRGQLSPVEEPAQRVSWKSSPQEEPPQRVWWNSSPEQAVQEPVRLTPLQRETSQGSQSEVSNAASMMSGSEIDVEVLEPREDFPDHMSGGETETEEEEEEVVVKVAGPSDAEKRRRSFEKAVAKGVTSLAMLQKNRDFIWAQTFGYESSEKLFPSFLEAQDNAIAKAVSEWPLNPTRLYEVAADGKQKAELSPQQAASGGIRDDILPDEGRRNRLSKVTAGLLPIAGTWTSNGVQFFYIDMAAGPFCVFPEKAMVMELWRCERLVHVGAALLSNDWKVGSGAFGRFASGGVEVQDSDKVAFPTCSHFHRNFQDFMDSCIGKADER